MFAPTACTTPTRLPTLMWSLAVALLLLSVFAPAFAMEAPAQSAVAAPSMAAAQRLEIDIVAVDGNAAKLPSLPE